MNGGELRDDRDRIRGAGVAVGAHLVEVIVLVHDGLGAVLGDPGREEDGAVEASQPGQDIHDDAGAGGLGPGDLEHVVAELDEVHLLVANPASADVAGVDPVVDGGGVLDVQLVDPAVGVGVQESVADDAGQVLRRVDRVRGLSHGLVRSEGERRSARRPPRGWASRRRSNGHGGRHVR